MKDKIKTYFWIGIYIFMVILPLLLLLIFPRPEAREPLRETSVILGFLAMSLWGMQTIPISRFTFLITTFSLESLQKFHYRLSIPAFIFVLAHPILLFINNPNTLRLLYLGQPPWRANAGVIALLLMVVLLITSVWRETLNLDYEIWRWVHDALAFSAIGFSLYHMFRVNYYMSMISQQVVWLALTGIWVVLFVTIRVTKP